MLLIRAGAAWNRLNNPIAFGIRGEYGLDFFSSIEPRDRGRRSGPIEASRPMTNDMDQALLSLSHKRPSLSQSKRRRDPFRYSPCEGELEGDLSASYLAPEFSR